MWDVRASPAHKGWRVYLLDAHPDAVAHCLPWTLWWVEICQDEVVYALMDPMQVCPGKGLALPNINIDQISQNTRFVLIFLPNNEMSKKSPFAIHKALIGKGVEPKSVKRLRSRDLLVEMNSTVQTKLLDTTLMYTIMSIHYLYST
ncbi:hypothetical protein TNCV_4328621 [Trichonephila clavipes]|nr:hypothetical protein TNCV_4328621 [Trichonephila clavipes]